MVTIIKKGAAKEDMQKVLNNLSVRQGFNAYKYCGVLKLDRDPLAIQKTLRSEWE
jgi:hypothetical protein